ncbi:MAG: DegT/DnrJ/EryC1/StrS family aminotransferase [Actinomycetota bacterium]|nr:DegT/DnrJ/EryC1/StrS family aminotransferase [Actinomycetota bacterium]
MSDVPAVLGGKPVFDPPLPFAQPTVENAQGVSNQLREALESGRLTDGPKVELLERRVEEAFQVPHCVAVSSCTMGLMLVIQALEARGPALVPSFTFSATAHAARWNGLDVTFADCDPGTWCLRPQDVHGKPDVVVGVHVSGVPCDVEGLSKTAADLGASLIFDAAHASGSLLPSGRRPLGAFGIAEVLSLTPTKVMSSAEGGLVTTTDASLAEHLRIARNYGNPGDYDTRFPGLNARLSELHAIVALGSLDRLEERVAHRNAVADRYHQALGDIPGVGFQQVPEGARSSYKDFTVLVDAERFGASRDAVDAALHADGIQTRRYYSPPVHRQAAYRPLSGPPLPVTDRLAAQVISLPIWSHLPLESVDRVGEAFHRIRAHADQLPEP